MNGVSVVITNSMKKIIWCNQEFLEMTGFRRSELIGNSPGKMLQGPDTEIEIVERLRKAFRDQVPVSGTITNYHKNGTAYPCSIAIHPIFDLENTKELTGFIAFEVDAKKSDLSESDLLKIKYSNTNIPSQVKAAILVGIDEEINNKFYLKTATLKELSDRIGTNPRYLSQVIHEEYGKHFSSWVNKFRVEEAKIMFADGSLKNLTFEGVATEVGFKSYSSFFSAFKTFEGRSPQQWTADEID